ncbi:uncharacterized protein LOC132302949 [Cornus florida]|uniref:uncharacterized protein LOC132302949 n=1 Tax=Cornus florida TaxID=4283 RepID=UPI00289DB41A|nr:uncharacterized protein LOC132302949 [Cornus florida]
MVSLSQALRRHFVFARARLAQARLQLPSLAKSPSLARAPLAQARLQLPSLARLQLPTLAQAKPDYSFTFAALRSFSTLPKKGGKSDDDPQADPNTNSKSSDDDPQADPNTNSKKSSDDDPQSDPNSGTGNSSDDDGNSGNSDDDSQSDSDSESEYDFRRGLEMESLKVAKFLALIEAAKLQVAAESLVLATASLCLTFVFGLVSVGYQMYQTMLQETLSDFERANLYRMLKMAKELANFVQMDPDHPLPTDPDPIHLPTEPDPIHLPTDPIRSTCQPIRSICQPIRIRIRSLLF